MAAAPTADSTASHGKNELGLFFSGSLRHSVSMLLWAPWKHAGWRLVKWSCERLWRCDDSWASGLVSAQTRELGGNQAESRLILLAASFLSVKVNRTWVSCLKAAENIYLTSALSRLWIANLRNFLTLFREIVTALHVSDSCSGSYTTKCRISASWWAVAVT